MDKLIIKIEIDGYAIGVLSNESLFMVRPDGNGVEVSNKEFKEFLEKFLNRLEARQ